jgi:hypothetical protein
MMAKMLVELMCDVRAECEVYQLLHAYIEAGGYAGKPGFLPPGMATAVTTVNDVRQRYLALIGELDAASKHVDDEARLMLKEALHVFRSALYRLQLFEREKQRPLAAYVATHGTWAQAHGSANPGRLPL